MHVTHIQFPITSILSTCIYAAWPCHHARENTHINMHYACSSYSISTNLNYLNICLFDKKVN